MAEHQSRNEVGIPTNGVEANAERNRRLNRTWLFTNLAVAVLLAVFFYLNVASHDASISGSLDDEYLMALSFAAAIWSLVTTLFVFGIPSRLAMNLIVQSRRRPYGRETIVLAITFVALAWMFYILRKVPMEG